MLAQDVGFFRSASQELLTFKKLEDDIACHDVDPEEPPHLRLGQLESGHFPVLGLHKLEKALDARLH